MLENKNTEGKEASSTSKSTTSQNNDIAGNIDVLQSQHSNGTPCKNPKLEAFGNISDENKGNNSQYTSRSIGIQCNTYVKCLISVGVQTDVSALNTTRFAEQAVQCEASSTANPDTSEQNVGMQCDPAPVEKEQCHNEEPKGSSPLSTCRKSTESPPLLDMADNKNSDSDYEPDEESVSEDSESSDETDVAMEIIQCKKYLVFESELEKLFSVCPHCTGPITSMAKRNIGSMVVISYSCINGHSSHWNSQPLINAMPAGNLILSAATLFSGNTFASINSFGSFCNIPLISKTKFFDIQKQYLWPAVNNAWKNTYQKFLS